MHPQPSVVTEAQEQTVTNTESSHILIRTLASTSTEAPLSKMNAKKRYNTATII